MISEAHCIDCLEFMKQQPDKRFDLVVADPPYGDPNNIIGGGQIRRLVREIFRGTDLREDAERSTTPPSGGGGAGGGGGGGGGAAWAGGLIDFLWHRLGPCSQNKLKTPKYPPPPLRKTDGTGSKEERGQRDTDDPKPG